MKSNLNPIYLIEAPSASTIWKNVKSGVTNVGEKIVGGAAKGVDAVTRSGLPAAAGKGVAKLKNADWGKIGKKTGRVVSGTVGAAGALLGGTALAAGGIGAAGLAATNSLANSAGALIHGPRY